MCFIFIYHRGVQLLCLLCLAIERNEIRVRIHERLSNEEDEGTLVHLTKKLTVLALCQVLGVKSKNLQNRGQV